MSFVKDMRERQAVATSERSGMLGTVLFAAAAFAVGGLAILGWKMFPSIKQQVAAITQGGPSFPGVRLGRVAAAPLLRACVNNGLLRDLEPEMILMLLQAGQAVSQLAPAAASKLNTRGQSLHWGAMADCVYQQNSWSLCNIDNRALAVEAASAVFRQAAQLAAKPPGNPATERLLHEHEQSKQRITDALQARVRTGHLIASDFGLFAPAEIQRVLAGIKPAANGCTKS